MSNPNACDVCTERGWVYTLAIMSVGAVVAPSLLLFYVWLLNRYPWMIKRWLSTIMIIVNHAQTIAIIATLRLRWPRLVLDIMHLVTFAFFIFDFDGIACVPIGGTPIGTNAGIAFWVSNIIMCGLVLGLLLSVTISIRVLMWRANARTAIARAATEDEAKAEAQMEARAAATKVARNMSKAADDAEHRVDWLVLLLSVILSTVFTTGTRFSLKVGRPHRQLPPTLHIHILFMRLIVLHSAMPPSPPLAGNRRLHSPLRRVVRRCLRRLAWHAREPGLLARAPAPPRASGVAVVHA